MGSEKPDRLAPQEGLRLVRAPNASPMTFTGTNTYILGEGKVVVIDPGPDRDDHLSAISEALGPKEEISHILVTHSHVDHSPLSRRLSCATDAPVLAFGDSAAGRSAHMDHLHNEMSLGGGEGIDEQFMPDHHLADGATVETPAGRIEAIWTPGHLGNHMCFAWQDVLFTGDHVMGWASSMVSPPDGDLTAFMQSTRKLLDRSDKTYYPGHGEAVENPQDRAAWLIDHRTGREDQILAALDNETLQIDEITRTVYGEAPPGLLLAAQRNVLAHLIDLSVRDLVESSESPNPRAYFSLKK